MRIEKELEALVKNYLASIGAYQIKVQSGKIMQSYQGKQRWIHLAKAGTPDLVFCIKGRFVAIELKKDKNQVEKWELYPLGKRGMMVKHDKRIEAQKHHRGLIRDAGGVHILACSVEEIDQKLFDEGLINKKYLLI